MICPMFNDDCPHCSEITRVSEFTIVKRDNRSGLFVPVKQGSKIVPTGECFCNNDGTHTVNELKYCPRRWALYSSKTAIYLGGLKRAKTTTKVAKPKAKPGATRQKKPGRKTTKTVKPRVKTTGKTTKKSK